MIVVKVSIVVPVYNVEKYLPDCINSLINQTLHDIEIILVDDGSPDNCPQICDEYSSRDNRIKVIHKKNAGVSAARNDGLAVASGEYIIFCDSDDWMDVSGLEKLYNKAVESNSDIIIGDVYMSRESGNKYVKFYENEFDTMDKQFISELIKADIYRTYCPLPPKEGVAFGYGGPWNKIVRRELLLDNQIKFDLRVKGVFDDILYTAHILSNATKISYIQKPVYFYRILSNSITHSFKPNVVEINKAIFNSWQEFFNKQDKPDIFDLPFYACVMRRLEEAVNLYFVNQKNDKDNSVLKKELKELLKTEPYYTAVRKVDMSKISKKQKLLAYLGRNGLISLVYLTHIFR